MKKVTGGILSDEAAAILRQVSEADRGKLISRSLEEAGPRNVTIIQNSNAGFLNNSFNGWFANWRTKVALMLRANFPDWFDGEGIPRPVLVFGGAIGMLYLLTVFGVL